MEWNENMSGGVRAAFLAQHKSGTVIDVDGGWRTVMVTIALKERI